mgnify:FL=1
MGKKKIKTRPPQKPKIIKPVSFRFEDGNVIVKLDNGEAISNPLNWHPWLKNAKPEQLENVEFMPFSIWWPDLDEGLDIDGMRMGIPSDNSIKTSRSGE